MTLRTLMCRLLDLEGRYTSDCEPWWAPFFWGVLYIASLVVYWSLS